MNTFINKFDECYRIDNYFITIIHLTLVNTRNKYCKVQQ